MSALKPKSSLIWILASLACSAVPSLASAAEATALPSFDPATVSQSLDDLDYGVRSGLLASTIASGHCVCQFVEGVDPKTCLDRVELQQKADLLLDVRVDEKKGTVTASPNWLAQFLVIGGGPKVVAQYDLAHPQFGCRVIQVGKQKAQ